MSTYPIYCINLKKCLNRKCKMTYRFNSQNLSKDVIFIDAVSKDDEIINFYGDGLNNYLCWDPNKNSVIACFASHLKSIKTFYESSTEKYGIICEDDIMLINNFSKKLSILMDNVPEETPLVSLSYLVRNWEGCHWVGIDPDKNNLYNIVPDYLWGTQMYIISRKYAREVLETYDKPFRFLNGHITAELITRFSDGYITPTPLAIEDCVNSNIRNDSGLLEHVSDLKCFCLTDYIDGELFITTPLAKYTDVNSLLINGFFISVEDEKILIDKKGSYDENLINELLNNKSVLLKKVNTIFISNENVPLIDIDIFPNIPVLSKITDDYHRDIKLPNSVDSLILLLSEINLYTIG